MAFTNDAEFQDDFHTVGPDATADFAAGGAANNPTGHASSENFKLAADDIDDIEDDEEEDDLEDEENEDDDLEDDDEEDDEDLEDDSLEDDEEYEDEEDDNEDIEEDEDDIVPLK